MAAIESAISSCLPLARSNSSPHIMTKSKDTYTPSRASANSLRYGPANGAATFSSSMTWMRFVLARDSLECEVNYVMSNTKKKFAFWLTPKTKELVERSYQLDNSQSQSEFIEKAIQFYTGYLEAEQDGSYLPVTLSATLEGSLGALGDRLGKLLFKMSVEMSMMMHLMAHDTDATLNELEQLRGRCVQDVMRTHGMISFKEIFRFQKRL